MNRYRRGPTNPWGGHQAAVQVLPIGSHNNNRKQYWGITGVIGYILIGNNNRKQ